MDEDREAIVSPDHLPKWEDDVDDDDEFGEGDDDIGSGLVSGSGLYSVNNTLNGKVAIWQGNITQLAVDAIVNNTNRTLSDRTEISGFIHDAAGHELEQACQKLKCEPGEAVATRSFKIEQRGGAKHIIHTVAPEWKDDSDYDPKDTLAKCYDSIFAVVKQERIKSLAICVLKRKDYPREQAANICCKALRENLQDTVMDLVVLVFRQSDVYDQMIYEITLPNYFPRNSAEFAASQKYLEDYNKTRKAELEAEKEEHNVMSNMAQSLQNSFVGGDRNVIPDDELDEFNDFGDDPPPTSGVGWGSSVVQHEDSLRNLYEQALHDDLRDVASLEFMFSGGKDPQGRPVVFFIEAHLPNKKEMLQDVLKYMIFTLNKVADEEYVLVFIARLSRPEYVPDFAWFRQAYNMFDRRFKKNLKQIFIVHPAFWVKAVLVMCRPFISSKLYDKITYIDKLVEIYPYIPRGTFYLPDSPSIRLYLDGDELPASMGLHKGSGPPSQEVVEAVADLKQAQAKVKDLEDELDKAAAAKEKLSKELLRMAGELGALEKERDKQLAKMREERAELVKEKQDLSSRVAGAEEEKGQVQHVQSVVSHLEGQLRQTQHERDELANELREIGEQLEQTLIYNKMISNELVKEANEIREGKVALVARMAQLEVALQTAEFHIELLKEELREVEEKNVEMKKFFAKQFADLQAEVASVRESAQGAINEASEARDKVFSQVAKQLTNSKGEQHDLQMEISQLEEDKEQLVQLILKLQDKLRSAKEEAENKEIGLNLDEVEQMIEEAEHGVEAIERKLNDDTDLDPQAKANKQALRVEIDELVERMVAADEEDKPKFEQKIKELEALLAVASKPANQDKEVMELDPLKLELEQGVALMKLQQKVFQIVKIMQLSSASPMQHAFLQWRAFVPMSQAEELAESLRRREEQLRRDKTRLNTKMRQLEDESAAQGAETEHLKKKLRDAHALNADKDAKIKELEDTIKAERTKHMAKMEEALAQMEEERDNLMDDNSNLLATIKQLRAELAAARSGGAEPLPAEPPRSVEAAA